MLHMHGLVEKTQQQQQQQQQKPLGLTPLNKLSIGVKIYYVACSQSYTRCNIMLKDLLTRNA